MDRRGFARGAGAATAAVVAAGLTGRIVTSSSGDDDPSPDDGDRSVEGAALSQLDLDALPEVVAGTHIVAATAGNLTEIGVDAVFAARAVALHAAAGDDAVAADASLRDDEELSLLVAANAVYEVTALVIYEAPAGTDLRIGFAGPAAATFDWGVAGLVNGAQAGSGSIDCNARTMAGTAVIGGYGRGAPLHARVSGILTIGEGSAGPFRFRWAQGRSGPTGTVRKAGSRLILRRLV